MTMSGPARAARAKQIIPRNASARSAKVGTGFASDRALTLDWRMILSANRKPTSPDHALVCRGCRGAVIAVRAAHYARVQPRRAACRLAALCIPGNADILAAERDKTNGRM